MDVLLNLGEENILKPYLWDMLGVGAKFPMDNPLRQFISLFILTYFGAFVMYFS